jgi:L-ascorbate metabolism protein UlaG (beta-lactamase superfamily)
MNDTMIRSTPDGFRALGPWPKGLRFDWDIANAVTLGLGETQDINGISFSTVKATHGPLTLKIGSISKTEYPGPNERIGRGFMGFVMTWNGRTLVTLGDTLMEKEAWSSIVEPDVLMLPLGGREAHNTMDVDDAVEAVRMMRPGTVIQMHYNLQAMFSRKYCPADDQDFRTRVEKIGSRCVLLSPGDTWRESRSIQ